MVSVKDKKCVLVAEDNKFQRMTLFQFMEMCDYSVVGAEDGVEALEHLRNKDNDFDLILLDLLMPKLDGFEVLKIIKEDAKMREIPVVVLSATDSQEYVSACICK